MPSSPPFIFPKLHGLGNDFLIADLRTEAGWDPSPQDPDMVRRLCDRHFGLGADGVLAILAPTRPGADARMRTLNADGSEAEMCGNGIRCVTKYLHDRGGIARSTIRVETLAGILSCKVSRDDDGACSQVAVDMGPARLVPADIPVALPGPGPIVEHAIESKGQFLHFTCVSMGNPHAVTFVEATGAALRELAESVGPSIEHHPLFPRRTNVEFARIAGAHAIELVVWERGVGITLACGTGACATVKAAVLTGRAAADREIQVHVLGGALGVTVPSDPDASVILRGPAAWVGDVHVDLAALRRTRP